MAYLLFCHIFFFAAGMGVDSPERQSGMEACGDRALPPNAGEPLETLSQHHFGARTMSGQPVKALREGRPYFIKLGISSQTKTS